MYDPYDPETGGTGRHAMSPIGPIIDGHVEIPLGSGNHFRADGMLSRHPQCDEIRAVAKRVTGRDWPDVPVVMDHFCPRHQAYVFETMMVMNRPGETIERVVIVDDQTAEGILDGMMENAPRMNVNTFLRPHTPAPVPPTRKDTEIARITDRVDFEETCIHRREKLEALVREAYEAGQRDPLPEPIGPSDNNLWSPED